MTPDELKRHPSVIRLYQSKVPRLRKERGEWIGLCPIHEEKTPSFHVKEKDGVLLWKCFGCGKGGSVIDLVMELDGSNLASGIRTVEEFCTGTWEGKSKRVDSSFASVGKPEPEVKKLVTYKLSQWERFEKELDGSSVAKAWLAGRGIDYDTAKSLHWGYRQSTADFCKNPEAESGWIAFPYIEAGIIKGIKYRSIVTKAFVCQPHMQIGLYNTDCIDSKEPLFVVEGEVDCATLVQAGYKAVSLPSASFNITPQHKDILMKAAVVYLAGDSDAAGAGAMDKLWRGLDRTYKLDWPSGMKDANQTLLDYPGPSFKDTIEEIVRIGLDKPIPHIYSLQGAMLSQDRTRLVDNPARMHMPWPEVDHMATLLPGSVMVLFSTNALASGTGVMTPGGARPVETIKVGDSVIGSDGLPTKVIGVFPKGQRPMTRINFCDGTSAVCDEEHLWKVYDRYMHKYRVRETREIRSNKIKYDRTSRYYIPLVGPVKFPEAVLPLNPYVLGALLGDGSFKKYVNYACHPEDIEIINKMRANLPKDCDMFPCPDGFHWYIRNKEPRKPNHVRQALRQLGLLGRGGAEKFIPQGYLNASLAQRQELLQGLLDTDGSCRKTGLISFLNTSSQLVEDLAYLVRSLGGFATIRRKGKHSTLHASFPESIRPFYLNRKARRTVYNRDQPGAKVKRKNIESFEDAGVMDCVCLAVEAEDGLFCIDDFVLTHNTKMAKTTLLMNLTLYGARHHGEVVLNYSAELTPEEIGSMVNAHVLRKDRNHLTASDGRDAVAKLTGVKYYIGRDPTLTTVNQVLDLMEAGVKRLGATLVCLDTIHFFTNGDDAVQQQAAAMQRFKLMATKYGFKGVVVAQPRKAKSSDKGKIVHLVDLKGSEALGSSADAVFAMHRDYVKTKTTASTEEYEPKTEIHLLAARSRGDGGVMAELFFMGKLASFEPLGSITTAPVPEGLDFAEIPETGNIPESFPDPEISNP